MALNLKRTGAAAAAGALSAAVDHQYAGKTLNAGGQMISYSAAAEAAELAVGFALQYFSPYMQPEIVDGVIDGAVALLARRGTTKVLNKTGTTAAGGYQYSPYATQVGGYAAAGHVGAGSPFAGRGQISSLAGAASRRSLT